MTFWYMTEADLTAFHSGFDAFESYHYENPRERANAIALSDEKELVTAKALHQHARELRAALR